MMEENKVISPVLVAAKLAAAESLEEPELHDQLRDNPRLVEMIWFIQWCSMQPGGLKTLVSSMLSQFPNKFISARMHKVGLPTDGRYSIEQCMQI